MHTYIFSVNIVKRFNDDSDEKAKTCSTLKGTILQSMGLTTDRKSRKKTIETGKHTVKATILGFYIVLH